MAAPEAVVQRAILRLLDVALPHGWLTVHIANKPRSAQSGALEKSLGAKSGFPDLLVFGPPQFIGAPHVYAIEVKAAKGKVRPEQQAMHDRLRDIGIPIAVCRSTDDVLAFGHDWQWPWRIAA